ncbi:hypothetical protein GCM10025868_15460 [Angustibacter aerolatus]|uniref:Uncharacterized protein n=1 Tax=Angustibacter aerolatus TaxID=1162965 RepID=A0ABQ6JFF0_9ACTN|nr:hypothetical protein GCM10025868_15460 [Angustibacter aerolatus]
MPKTKRPGFRPVVRKSPTFGRGVHVLTTVPFVVHAGGQGVAQAGADDEQFERPRSETECRCPVTSLFERSGLDLDSEWTREPLSA